MSAPWIIRAASFEDADAVLTLFDEAIAWFGTFGNERQWGTKPWSTQQRPRAQISKQLSGPGAWVAELEDGTLAGALVLGAAPHNVPPATEPELYVRTLVGSRNDRARGAGRALMTWAEHQARLADVSFLRLDCYGGGSGALVSFYESCGYQRMGTFELDGWPGQILGRRLDLLQEDQPE